MFYLSDKSTLIDFFILLFFNLPPTERFTINTLAYEAIFFFSFIFDLGQTL